MRFSKPAGIAAVMLVAVLLPPADVGAQTAVAEAQAAPAVQSAATPRELSVTVGKSLVLDSPVTIERVSIGNGDLAEAVAVTPREVLINGKLPGETSLVIWQQGGNRLLFDLRIHAATLKLETMRRELARELSGQEVSVTVDDSNIFLRGTVNDLVAAERAVSIAATFGKPVNLLHVRVPPVEPQILLKVRFADVDRAASHDLGLNLFSAGALNTQGSLTTGTFTPPTPQDVSGFRLTDALNIFIFRPDLNLGATIRALESKRMLQILAEPNLLTINGKSAAFLAGGEFPYPTLQGGGAGLGAVTIQFREFGVRLSFLPHVTPRNTVRLQVTPEVSSLDFANGLIFQGFTIPALSTRRVQTEVELESGQSFAIGGLLDNRLTETLNKVPGLGDIPLFGKLFQSRQQNKTNTELLVLVTPELVRPIPAGQPLPEVKFPREIRDASRTVPRTPGLEVTGPVPVKPSRETVPVEQLKEAERSPSGLPASMGPLQLVPAPMAPPPAAPAPVAPRPAASPGDGKGGSQR